MPTLNDDFQAIEILQDNNQLLSAVALGLLLPVLDTNQWNITVLSLFGTIPSEEDQLLMKELNTYSSNHGTTVLTKLINTYLRPKLAEYMKAHEADFVGLCTNPMEFEQKIEALKSPHTLCGEIEIKGLAQLLQKRIEFHTDIQANIDESISESAIHLLKQEAHYQLLLDYKRLNPILRAKLAPMKALTRAITGDVPTYFRRVAFEQRLKRVLQDIPKQVTALAATAPAYMGDTTALSLFSQKEQLTPRYENEEEEIQAIAADLSKNKTYRPVNARQVRNLSSSNLGTSRLTSLSYVNYFRLVCESSWAGLYDPTQIPVLGSPLAFLSLMVTLGVPAVGSIYAVEYQVALKAAERLLHQGNYLQAAKVLDAEFNRALIPRTTRAIYLTKEDYTQAHFLRGMAWEGEEEITKAYAEYQLAYQDAVQTGKKISKFIVKLQQFKLLHQAPQNQLPAGMNRVRELERMHRDLTTHFPEGFSDLFFDISSQITRSAARFITKKSLSQTEIAAANQFLKTKNLFLLQYFANGRGEFLQPFVTFYQGLILAIFNHANADYLQQDIKALLIEELHIVNGSGKKALSALILKKFLQCTEQLTEFKKKYKTNSTILSTISSIINFIETSIIDICANIVEQENSLKKDYYSLAEKFSIAQEDADLLLDKAQKSTEFLTKLYQAFGLTFNSMDACFDALSGRELTLITVTNQNIDTSELSRELSLLIQHKHRYYFYDATISITTLTELDASILLASHLPFPEVGGVQVALPYHSKHQLIYEHIAAKNANTRAFAPVVALQELIDANSGDTLLHVLVKMPANQANLMTRIQTAALQLADLSGVRNLQDETPLSLLKAHDPYHLIERIDKKSLVKTDELTQIERILNHLSANPNLAGHFILLDGPPGTGKTSAVLTHLKSLGYPICEWIQGTEQDRFVGALSSRVSQFFTQAKVQAQKNAETLQILFIDEINIVIPKLEGTAQRGYHNHEEVVGTFLTEITALKGHRVVLIGATNYVNLLPEPILSRSLKNRIYFPLPNTTERQQLLMHCFRVKRIALSSIEKLAQITKGYSQRQLEGFVESLEARDISFAEITRHFNAYARQTREDFKGEFNCAEIFMPSFENDGCTSLLFSPNEELQEQLHRIQHHDAIEPRLHTLVSGPPGCGKTQALRLFAQNAGCILIAVNTSQNISLETLQKIFCRAKQLGRVIIFFDEMDRIAATDSYFSAFLQTEMDGIMANDVTVIGVTNYPERFEPAILRRFYRKIILSAPRAIELARPIQQTLLNAIRNYPTKVYVDDRLAEEIETNAIDLAHEAVGLDLGLINAAIQCLMVDLKRENTNGGITYLRFQDVYFAFLIMKIQEKIIQKPAEGVPIASTYIRENAYSFFPSEIPAQSRVASTLALSPTLQKAPYLLREINFDNHFGVLQAKWQKMNTKANTKQEYRLVAATLNTLLQELTAAKVELLSAALPFDEQRTRFKQRCLAATEFAKPRVYKRYLGGLYVSPSSALQSIVTFENTLNAMMISHQNAFTY